MLSTKSITLSIIAIILDSPGLAREKLRLDPCCTDLRSNLLRKHTPAPALEILHVCADLKMIKQVKQQGKQASQEQQVNQVKASQERQGKQQCLQVQ